MAKKNTTKNKSQKTVQQKQKTETNKTPYQILWLVLSSILLGIFLYWENDAFASVIVNQFLYGLFGRPAVFIPPTLLGLAIYVFKNGKESRLTSKLIFSTLTIINISSIVHLCYADIIDISISYERAANPFMDSVGGGLLGSLIACPLKMIFTRPGAIILLLVSLSILVSTVLERAVYSIIAGYIHGTIKGLVGETKKINAKDDYNRTKEIATKKAARIASQHSDEVSGEGKGFALIDEAKNFANDKDGKKNKNPFKKKEKNIDDSAPNPDEEDIIIEGDDFDSNGIDEIFSKMLENNEELKKIQKSGKELMEETLKEDYTKLPPEREDNLTEIEKEEISAEINENTEPVVRDYVFPKIDLLNKPKDIDSDQRMAMYETANQLISILEDFGVKAKLLQVSQGPSVTRYEIQPSTGVKLAKIQGLADDIALNLAVNSVLVAPVPGKAAVGIEVPNREVASVSGRELLESEEFDKSKSKLTIALGKDIGGRVVVGDIAKMPHVLIAGATGSGKSVCINTIITSILYKASPDEVKLIMVDPKVVELGEYNGIPHLLIPVVTDPKRAAGALNWAVAEMMHRYDLFANNAVRNLAGYNSLMEKQKMAKLPQIVIIIDELADLMMVAAKEVEDYICRLAQLARAAGIHLIIATQRPSVDVITGLIKANIPSRIAFAVSSQIDSRTILDRGGAEKLLGSGDMLYYPSGARVPQRVQGAFISDEEIEQLIKFIKSENPTDDHYSEDLQEHIDRVSTGENGVTPDTDDDFDELLPQAMDIAAELGQISTAMIQRKLKVGYARAGRIIDQLESRELISSANGSKPREVYLNKIAALKMSMQTPVQNQFLDVEDEEE